MNYAVDRIARIGEKSACAMSGAPDSATQSTFECPVSESSSVLLFRRELCHGQNTLESSALCTVSMKGFFDVSRVGQFCGPNVVKLQSRRNDEFIEYVVTVIRDIYAGRSSLSITVFRRLSFNRSNVSNCFRP